LNYRNSNLINFGKIENVYAEDLNGIQNQNQYSNQKEIKYDNNKINFNNDFNDIFIKNEISNKDININNKEKEKEKEKEIDYNIYFDNKDIGNYPNFNFDNVNNNNNYNDFKGNFENIQNIKNSNNTNNNGVLDSFAFQKNENVYNFDFNNNNNNNNQGYNYANDKNDIFKDFFY
jgi:hypothetical protein